MPFNPFINRDTPVLYDGYVGTCIVTQLARPYRTKRRNRVRHEFWEGAPCVWSRDRGATHTLLLPEDRFLHGARTRPARLLKTCAYVGLDEADNDIVWERWALVPNHSYWPNSTFFTRYAH
ncbi:hypothetical protein EBZ80_19150 [bacterium]|nr:hypothetical protein [bacterium]